MTEAFGCHALPARWSVSGGSPQAYLVDYPGAKAQELVTALSLSLPTVRKYMKEVQASISDRGTHE
jgi:hypothetical protein